jgi:putative (di)nucleoside polyphosphate hydrolase
VFFRAGVGILIRNRHGEVLAFERASQPGAWQAPQGGIDEGERPVDAVARELFEETGLSWDQVSLVDEHPEWLSYQLPEEARSTKTGVGQTQRWFLVEYRGDRPVTDLLGASGEFSTARWMPMRELVDAVWAPRRPIYLRLLQRWFRDTPHPSH